MTFIPLTVTGKRSRFMRSKLRAQRYDTREQVNKSDIVSLAITGQISGCHGGGRDNRSKIRISSTSAASDLARKESAVRAKVRKAFLL